MLQARFSKQGYDGCEYDFSAFHDLISFLLLSVVDPSDSRSETGEEMPREGFLALPRVQIFFNDVEFPVFSRLLAIRIMTYEYPCRYYLLLLGKRQRKFGLWPARAS